MAQKTSLSKSTIRRIWRKFELKRLVQVVRRSAVRRQRRSISLPVTQSDRVSGGAVRRQEGRNASTRSLATGASDDAGYARAVQPRLRTIRSDEYGGTAPHVALGGVAAFDIAYGAVISAIRHCHRAVAFNTIDRAISTELDVHVVCEKLTTRNRRRPRLAGQRPPIFAATSPLHAAGTPTRLVVVDQPGRTVVRVSHTNSC